MDNGPSIDGHTGGQYFIGQFDGTTFICDDPPTVIRSLDFGADFYAAQSWSDAPDGRRVWLAWMSHWAYAAKTPTSPWRGMMTLPREVSLRERDGTLVLTQQPASELAALRAQHWHIKDATSDGVNRWPAEQGIRGVALVPTPLTQRTTVKLPPALPQANEPNEQVGICVRTGAGEETRISYDGRELFIDRGKSGQNHFSPRFDDRHAEPLKLKDDTLSLRVFVDACSVEVFTDHGAVVLSELIFSDTASEGMAVFGDMRVVSMDMWGLA